MIVTKAYIKSLPESGSNIFKVEVPLMEDNTGTEAIFDALLSTPPGVYKGLKVGDAVFVTFEDDMYNTAIILGSLFTEIPTESSTYEILNDLKVTEAASLPPQTRFGDYTAQDIMNLYNKGGGGDGTLNEEDLKQYVQWVNTEVINSEGETVDMYADKIQVMTGSEYDLLIASVESEGDADLTFFNETLYFLLSLPATDAVYLGPSEGIFYLPIPDKKEEDDTPSWEAYAKRMLKWKGKKIKARDIAVNIGNASLEAATAWFGWANHYDAEINYKYHINILIILEFLNQMGYSTYASKIGYIYYPDYHSANYMLTTMYNNHKGDWTKIDNAHNNSNKSVKIGDIIIFTKNGSGVYPAVVVDKDNDNNYLCLCDSSYGASVTSTTATTSLISTIMSRVGANNYSILRKK